MSNIKRGPSEDHIPLIYGGHSHGNITHIFGIVYPLTLCYYLNKDTINSNGNHQPVSPIRPSSQLRLLLLSVVSIR